MTEDNIDVQESELDSLKARATQMGIKFHPSSGVDSLKDKINAALADVKPAPAADTVVEPGVETPTQTKIRQKKEATKLVRVRVACMNPNKKEWEGEIFTTGNAVVGTIKKFVKFDEEWHVPSMILDMMDQRRCQVFYTVVNKATRIKSRKGKLVKEFAIEILPDLTATQLHDLRQRQAMANGPSLSTPR